MADSQKSLQAGTVIRVSRGLYDHYGVYIGKSKVIHFSDGIIKKDTLRKFSNYSKVKKSIQGGNPFLAGYAIMPRYDIEVEVTVDVMAFDPDYLSEISNDDCVERACSLLGCDGYNLFQNNCEHFAIWARTGIAESSQAFGSHSSMLGSFSCTRIITMLSGSTVGMTFSREVIVD